MSDKKKSSDDVSDITEEDRRLFRKSIGSVKKININQTDSFKQKPQPVPRQHELDNTDVLQQMAEDPFAVDTVETGDELSFFRPGVQKQTLRKLRRGQYTIEQELDLHGFTVAESKPVLNRFLTLAIQTGKRCVRIIHGKGHGSKNKTPVLKNKINGWLQKDDRVLAFTSARQIDGGTGAIYVLLKKA